MYKVYQTHAILNAVVIVKPERRATSRNPNRIGHPNGVESIVFIPQCAPRFSRLRTEFSDNFTAVSTYRKFAYHKALSSKQSTTIITTTQ